MLPSIIIFHIKWGRTFCTIFPSQPLGNYEVECTSHHIRQSSQIKHPTNSLYSRIGMDSTKHQMSSHGRFHSHFQSLGITDLSHHDYIRVLPQSRSQTTSKCKSYIRSYLCLIQSFHFIFNWVLKCSNIYLWRINMVQTCIQSRCFS